MKTKLFTCYSSNVYLCSLWVKFRKSSMHHFIVSYNNAFRILHGLPMRCSASGMFASSGVNSCQTLIRVMNLAIPGTRRRGRPKKTWNQQLKDDMTAVGYGPRPDGVETEDKADPYEIGKRPLKVSKVSKH